MTQHPNTAAEVVATFTPPADRPLRIVVLASGQGSLFQSLLDTWANAPANTNPEHSGADESPEHPGVDANPEHPRVEIAALVCDKPCPALDRARQAGVEATVVELPPLRDLTPELKQVTRRRWDADLTRVVAAYSPDIVVSAGFMRILGAEFLAEFGGRTINTHPALLPAFPGAHAVPDAVAYGAKVTGSTIHLVDAGVDTGPILAQEAVPIHPGETADVVHERIKIVERRLLVSVIDAIAERGFTSDGRKATLLS